MRACVLPCPRTSTRVPPKASCWTDGGTTPRVVSNTQTVKCETQSISFSDVPTLSHLIFSTKEEYMTSCPPTFVYDHQMTSCHRTCRSLSQSDPACEVKLTPLDGCGCAEGTYLNEKGKCVSESKCPCYVGETVLQPKQVIKVHGQKWWGFPFLREIKQNRTTAFYSYSCSRKFIGCKT